MANLVYFFSQECNKGRNSTPLLHAINFRLFIRPTDRFSSVWLIWNSIKLKQFFVWDAL